MDEDLRSIQEARELARRAKAAQQRYALSSQEVIDRVVAAVAVAASRDAKRLAELAVAETGFGNVRDKTAKNRFASETIHDFIRPLKTVGVVRELPERGIVEIACAKGVVAAIIPSTNPTSTAIYKILIALKAGCGIVLSPHPSAVGCVVATADALTTAAEAAGAPAGLIGCMRLPSQPGTDALMRDPLTSVILATGGIGMVRAAYSAGKPAFGVGPGNVPAFIERTADVEKAVADIVASKTFDYGTICSSEQAVVVDRMIAEEVKLEFVKRGGFFLSREQIRTLGPLVITHDRRVNNAVVGRPAAHIARLAGIDVPEATTVLLAELREAGPHEPLSLEKLSPILAFYIEDGWEAACARCIEILNLGGLGHTMSIHSRDESVIRRFGLEKPVFRVIVNSPSTHGAIGITTGVDPSMTLGCGSLGGNITSDNITPLHLIDIKRLAYETRSLGTSPPSTPLVRSDASARSSPNRVRVESVVDDFFRSRGHRPVAVSATADQRPLSPPSAPESRPSALIHDVLGRDEPVDFVCEDDVRRALREQRTIAIAPRTIITPAARDLARSHDLFRNVLG